MQETIHLSDLWEHTITKIFKHDPESELAIKIRQWVIYNKLEDFNSLLNYTDEDFTPHDGGNIHIGHIKLVAQFSVALGN